MNFKKIGVTHPDDMFVIVLVSFHRKLTGKQLDLKSKYRIQKIFVKEKRGDSSCFREHN